MLPLSKRWPRSPGENGLVALTGRSVSLKIKRSRQRALSTGSPHTAPKRVGIHLGDLLATFGLLRGLTLPGTSARTVLELINLVGPDRHLRPWILSSSFLDVVVHGSTGLAAKPLTQSSLHEGGATRLAALF